MKKILLVLSLLLFLTVLFILCKNIFEKRILYHGIEDIIVGFDPAKDIGIIDLQVFSQIYETLITLDSDYKTLLPCLATNWSISEDNRSYIFNLRPNVLFHDGFPLTANDAQFSFNRQINHNRASPLFNMIDSIEILDSLTIRINLKYPYSPFLYTLASPTGLICISKNSLLKYGDDIAFHPIGTGPFRLKEWEKGKKIHLETFKYYWGDKESLDQIVFKIYKNNTAVQESIKKGLSDVLFGVSGFYIDRMKWLGTIDYKTLDSDNTAFLGFNNSTFPFNNKRIRKAILKAVNIKNIVGISRGNSIIAKGPLPPILYSYKTSQQERYDIESAKKILKEEGFPNGLDVKFIYPNMLVKKTLLEYIKFDLEKIDVTLDFHSFDTWDELYVEYKSNSSQIFLSTWGADLIGDAGPFLFSLFHSKSKHNFMNYTNKKVDDLLLKAQKESQLEQREFYYEEILKIIDDDTPAIFLYHVIPHFAYNSQKIKSLLTSPYSTIQYHRLLLN